MVKVSAPGKLFVSGEWAVLEVGNPGIVGAVNKRVFADIAPSTDDFIHISVDDFDISDVKAVFDGKTLNFEESLDEGVKRKLLFMKGAIEVTLKYVADCKPFSIRSWGEMSQVTLDGETKKVGFGSSAASVVATVAGLLKYFGHDITTRQTKDVIYKLAAIAHYSAQGKVGSAFDVAASTYGGLIVYKRFDPQWLIEQMEETHNIKTVVEQNWKGWSVEELTIPENFHLLVGWTKKSASTTEMVKQLNTWRMIHEEEYQRLFSAIGTLVSSEIPQWKEQNTQAIVEALRKNQELLRELGQKSGVPIETDDLKQLSEIANSCGAAGKLSGAGGGDCGIAVCFDSQIAQSVVEKWKDAGIFVIDARIDRDGVRED